MDAKRRITGLARLGITATAYDDVLVSHDVDVLPSDDEIEAAYMAWENEVTTTAQTKERALSRLAALDLDRPKQGEELQDIVKDLVRMLL